MKKVIMMTMIVILVMALGISIFVSKYHQSQQMELETYVPQQVEQGNNLLLEPLEEETVSRQQNVPPSPLIIIKHDESRSNYEYMSNEELEELVEQQLRQIRAIFERPEED